MTKTLHFRSEGPYGEWYAVNERGEITRPTHTYGPHTPSGQWRLLGIAHRWNRRGIDLNVAACFDNPSQLAGAYVFDFDHGAIRRWGRRIDKFSRAYVTEEV